jgi:arginase
VLRAGLSDADFQALVPTTLQPRQVFFGGVRAFDAPELEFVQRHGIPVFAPDALQADPSALARAVNDAGFSNVHVHLDLDVLEVDDFASSGFSSHGGLRLATLEAVILALREHLEIVSFAVTEFAPRNDTDLETVVRLVQLLEGQ